MVMSHSLVCLPGTISCFLPALSKPKFKDVVILESQQQSMDTYHWFTALGQSVENIQVITLNPAQMNVDQEQMVIDSQYKGFSVDEITGIRRPPQAPSSSTNTDTNANDVSKHQVANLSIGTTTLNKNFAPKDHDIDGYQLLAHDNSPSSANPDTDKSPNTDTTEDKSGMGSKSSSSMFKSVGDTQSDIEHRFGKGSFLFGENDSFQKVANKEDNKSAADQNDENSTGATYSTDEHENDSDIGGNASGNEQTSTVSESSESKGGSRFDFEGLFGSGNY